MAACAREEEVEEVVVEEEVDVQEAEEPVAQAGVPQVAPVEVNRVVAEARSTPPASRHPRLR